jgi:DNA-binding response OmpR family regulator
MPQMNGRVMVEQARLCRPAVNVLYMSAYTNDLIMRYGFANNNFAFIQKPFLPSAFIAQVRHALNAPVALAA